MGLEVIFWAKIYSFGSMCTGVHQFYGGEVLSLCLEKKIDGTNFELSRRLAQASWPAVCAGSRVNAQVSLRGNKSPHLEGNAKRFSCCCCCRMF